MNKFLGFLHIAYTKLVLPILYLFVMWATMVAAVAILFEDIFKGMGFVSAISLFCIVREYFYRDFFLAKVANDIQKQTKGK